MEFPPILKEVNELCRLCLADNCVLQDMFESTCDMSQNCAITLLEKISVSTSIQVQEADCFPTKICSDCSEQVEKLYAFKLKCLAADSLLRKHIRLKLDQKLDTTPLSSECSSIVNILSNTGEDAPSTDTSQSSFKYESEMLHVEIKEEEKEEEEEDVSDQSSSNSSENETVRPVKKLPSLQKNTKNKMCKDRKFFCQLCGKNFCNKFSLTRHKWSHSKQTTTCQYCNKVFKNRESQQRHEKMHEVGNRYKCHLCDKSYVSSTSHAAHVRKHTGERPFKCSDCDATFYLLSSFERHVVKHRGVKEYECEICTASFWVPDDLRAHVNRMH